MPTISAFNASVVIRGGVGTTAAPGRYFGFGTNAAFTASSGQRLYASSTNVSPNGVVTAPSGSMWLTLGGTVYVNTDGATAWSVQTSTSYQNTIADPGDAAAIPVTASGTVNLSIGAGAETNTLAIPTAVGQRLLISADTVGGGTRAITCAQAINIAGNTVMTFNAVRDEVVLDAITVAGALRWQVTVNNNAVLS